MPPKKQHKNKTSRRPRRSRLGKGVVRVSHNSGQFVPNEMKVSLRLTGHVENAASGTYAEAGFTINDMYDPQGSSGAGQCPGFDQMAILYRRYRVTSSSIKVLASLDSTSATPVATALEAQVVVYPASVTTGAATIDDGMSQPFVKNAFITGEKPCRLSSRISVSKLIGNTVNADRFQALTTASPAEVLYWHVGIISRAYTTISTMLAVEVTYEVTFFERNLLDRSTQLILHKAVLEIHAYRSEQEQKRPGFVNWEKSQPQLECVEESKETKNSINEGGALTQTARLIGERQLKVDARPPDSDTYIVVKTPLPLKAKSLK